MKQFTNEDVQSHGSWDGIIFCDRNDLEEKPVNGHDGRDVDGYGRKINSGLMIDFEGKKRRIYVTCYSNAGTAWFQYQGKQIVVA